MAETTYKIYFHSSMSSVEGLEITCNENEIHLKSKLTGLDTVTKPNGEKLTEAVYVKQRTRTGLGHLKIKKTSANDGATFKGKAFVLTQPVDVSVFRS